MIFLGKNFVIGLLGNPDALNLEDIEKECKIMSSKDIKVSKKEEVKFASKAKGVKPVVTKGIV